MKQLNAFCLRAFAPRQGETRGAAALPPLTQAKPEALFHQDIQGAVWAEGHNLFFPARVAGATGLSRLILIAMAGPGIRVAPPGKKRAYGAVVPTRSTAI